MCLHSVQKALSIYWDIILILKKKSQFWYNAGGGDTPIFERTLCKALMGLFQLTPYPKTP